MKDTIYLVCSYDSISGEDHKVIAAYFCWDKAEDYVLEVEPYLDKNKNLIIESIGIK